MGLLTWVLFGLIAGMLAKAIMPGPDPGGASSRFCLESSAPSSEDCSARRSVLARQMASTFAV